MYGNLKKAYDSVPSVKRRDSLKHSNTFGNKKLVYAYANTRFRDKTRKGVTKGFTATEGLKQGFC